MKTRKTLALLLSVVMLVGLLAAIGPAAAAADLAIARPARNTGI